MSKINEYLKGSELPVIPSAAFEEMERPISIEDLGTVVAALPMGKRTGPDGLN